MPTIFISYSRSDAQFVRRLVDHLESHEVDYWLDVDRIQTGEDWSDAVWSALQQCDLLLLVLSPASMVSKEVSNEWKYYHNIGKPIIPVLVDASTNIHYQLAALHYVDFDRVPFDEALQLLEIEINRVIRDLEQESLDADTSDEATMPSAPERQDSAEPPLPSTAVLDPSRLNQVAWDRTTARIDRDLAKQLEEQLHYFDEHMLLEFISYEQQDKRISARIRRSREYVVGRAGKGYSPDVDLTQLGAAERGISRKHATLKLDGDMLLIKDLNSTNYTYVEGKRLRGGEQLALKSGDRIQMGNLLMIVYFREDNRSQ